MVNLGVIDDSEAWRSPHNHLRSPMPEGFLTGVVVVVVVATVLTFFALLWWDVGPLPP
jgi:hypothetical protein